MVNFSVRPEINSAIVFGAGSKAAAPGMGWRLMAAESFWVGDPGLVVGQGCGGGGDVAVGGGAGVVGCCGGAGWGLRFRLAVAGV